jgi:hypothetical protein
MNASMTFQTEIPGNVGQQTQAHCGKAPMANGIFCAYLVVTQSLYRQKMDQRQGKQDNSLLKH